MDDRTLVCLMAAILYSRHGNSQYLESDISMAHLILKKVSLDKVVDKV